MIVKMQGSSNRPIEPNDKTAPDENQLLPSPMMEKLKRKTSTTSSYKSSAALNGTKCLGGALRWSQMVYKVEMSPKEVFQTRMSVKQPIAPTGIMRQSERNNSLEKTSKNSRASLKNLHFSEKSPTHSPQNLPIFQENTQTSKNNSHFSRKGSSHSQLLGLCSPSALGRKYNESVYQSQKTIMSPKASLATGERSPEFREFPEATPQRKKRKTDSMTIILNGKEEDKRWAWAEKRGAQSQIEIQEVPNSPKLFPSGKIVKNPKGNQVSPLDLQKNQRNKDKGHFPSLSSMKSPKNARSSQEGSYLFEKALGKLEGYYQSFKESSNSPEKIFEEAKQSPKTHQPKRERSQNETFKEARSPRLLNFALSPKNKSSFFGNEDLAVVNPVDEAEFRQKYKNLIKKNAKRSQELQEKQINSARALVDSAREKLSLKNRQINSEIEGLVGFITTLTEEERIKRQENQLQTPPKKKISHFRFDKGTRKLQKIEGRGEKEKASQMKCDV